MNAVLTYNALVHPDVPQLYKKYILKKIGMKPWGIIRFLSVIDLIWPESLNFSAQ